jgi:hypothetical protein
MKVYSAIFIGPRQVRGFNETHVEQTSKKHIVGQKQQLLVARYSSVESTQQIINWFSDQVNEGVSQQKGGKHKRGETYISNIFMLLSISL